jgi:LCP family protein required for cell wall assembly
MHNVSSTDDTSNESAARGEFAASNIHAEGAKDNVDVNGKTSASGNASTDDTFPTLGSEADASSAPTLERRRKRGHRKRNRRLKRILIFIVAVVVIAAAVCGAATFLNYQGSKNLTNNDVDIIVPDDAVSYDQGRKVVYDGHTYEFNDDVATICFIGYDSTAESAANGHNGQADTVMVFAIDTSTGDTTCITVPRDSYVEVGEFVGPVFTGMDEMQLCLAFAYGTDAATGAQYVANVASRILCNIPINQYFAMDLDGVGALANAVGGVALTPVQTVESAGAYAGVPTVLFGSNALSYVQTRDVDTLGSALERQERQMQFVSAWASTALSEALSAGGASVLIDLFNTALDYSTTSIGLSEVTYLANTLIQNGISSFDVTSLEGTLDTNGNFAKVYLSSDNTFEVVLDTFYNRID